MEILFKIQELNLLTFTFLAFMDSFQLDKFSFVIKIWKSSLKILQRPMLKCKENKTETKGVEKGNRFEEGTESKWIHISNFV